MLAAFTAFHVLLSLIGIAAGLVVAYGLLTSNRMDRLTAWFLGTTVATSVTGFLFPFHGITPGIVVGIISMFTLAAAIYGRYSRHLDGVWRKAYVIGAVVSLYFNMFVLIVQSFQKVPFLNALAPTQTEPPFAIAQALNLVAFIAIGVLGVKKFQPGQPSSTKYRTARA
jgi:hypothetical protein